MLGGAAAMVRCLAHYLDRNRQGISWLLGSLWDSEPANNHWWRRRRHHIAAVFAHEHSRDDVRQLAGALHTACDVLQRVS